MNNGSISTIEILYKHYKNTYIYYTNMTIFINTLSRKKSKIQDEKSYVSFFYELVLIRLN